MKKVFLHREAAYGDHIHCSPVIRAYYELGWQVDMLYNFKGAQIHTYNPMITNHFFFEAGAKDVAPEIKKKHHDFLRDCMDKYDRFVTLQQSLEGAIIFPEDSKEYFWPHWKRHAKSADKCFYDQSMCWAGITAPEFMGRTGDIFFKKDEHNIVLGYLEQFKDKFIILWAIRGSMYQKAMYPITEEICAEFCSMHPETIIITTGDKFCQQWEWEHPQVIHKSGRIPFRQALCMAQYVDLVVTPETGLGIGAGAFGTPKIMLLTAASITNIVGNDKNDYSLQSPSWCSPCFRAIYNTYNCPISENQKVNGKSGKFMVKSVDPTSLEWGKTVETALPICVDFPKEMVLARMEEVYRAKHERIWDRPKNDNPSTISRQEGSITTKTDIAYKKPPKSAIGSYGLNQLARIAETAPPGDFVEIGVYRGGSAWRLDKICRYQGRTLHLFDTFNGMPYSDPKLDNVPKGWFDGHPKEEIAAIFPDAKIYEGVFPDTLPDDLNNIAFVHVDCDQYESVKASIETMVDRLVPGGIMYFDDYSGLAGAKKAIEEVLGDDFIAIPGSVSLDQRAVWIKPKETKGE